jgi:RND family efflux transporter MFP subunit
LNVATHRTLRILLAGALLPGSLLLGAAGCAERTPAAVDSKPREAGERAVAVAHPAQQTLHRVVEQPGRIEAFEQTPIHAKIPGFIDKIPVEIGTRVKKGDLLAELYVPELAAEVTQKEAMVKQADLSIRRSESMLRVAAASVTTAQSVAREAVAARQRAEAGYARWKSESARFASLSKDGVVDAQSRDEVKHQFEAATAALAEAEAKIQSANAGVQEAEARRDQAETELAAARNQKTVAAADAQRVKALFGYSKITAPFDGIVSDRRVHTGYFVKGTSSASDEPLFTVVRMDKVRVFIEVPEADAVLVKPKQKGHVRVQVLNDRDFEGDVAGTSWRLNPTQRTLRTEIDLPNPTGILRPGMYVHASVPVDQPGAWTIPSAAVVIRDERTFCYVLESGKAVRTLLRLGSRSGDTVEVLKKSTRSPSGKVVGWENLTGKEQIVVSDAGELSDGQSIRVK